MSTPKERNGPDQLQARPGGGRAADEFVDMVSHELRSPLNAIAAGLTLLRQTAAIEGRGARALELIERNVDLQARLLGDLLDLSRVRRGELELARGPVDLERVVAAACQSCAPEVEAAGLTLTCRCEPGLWVHGDPDRLHQVVARLLAHAMKSTRSGGGVDLRCERGEGPRARVTVEGAGVGLDEASMEGLGARRQGLDIGLALARGLVERHGGRLWAEHAGVGQGSRVLVELPVMGAPRVLLVEDDGDTRVLLQVALEMRGYEVRAAPSGEAALAVLEGDAGAEAPAPAGGARAPCRPSWRPDVILSDIQMPPGIDGHELLRRARELPGLAAVPAFAITAYGGAEDVRRAIDAGFTGHLTKPVDTTELDRHLRGVLGARQR